MKKLTLILTLLFSMMMFSSPSYSDWTKVEGGSGGTNIYLDFDSMKKVDGYIYFWELIDYLKPNPFGSFSGKAYIELDCKLMRFKYLSMSHHKAQMGKDVGRINNPKNPTWMSIHPSIKRYKRVCTN